MREILKSRKLRITMIISAVILLLAVFIGWRYYKNIQIYDQYYGDGEIIGYEETERGLVVILRVHENPYHARQREIKLMIDEETIGLMPDLVYLMKERILGVRMQFSSRAFWLPDAIDNHEYAFPLKGGVLVAGEWFDLVEAGRVDEEAYGEYMSQYKSRDDLEWLMPD